MPISTLMLSLKVSYFNISRVCGTTKWRDFVHIACKMMLYGEPNGSFIFMMSVISINAGLLTNAVPVEASLIGIETHYYDVTVALI